MCAERGWQEEVGSCLAGELFRAGRFGFYERAASFLCDATDCWAGTFQLVCLKQCSLCSVCCVAWAEFAAAL